MLSDAKFQALLNRASKAAREHDMAVRAAHDAFVERYGATYSDVDADQIIDILNYQGGVISVGDCDTAMTERGCPPRKGVA